MRLTDTSGNLSQRPRSGHLLMTTLAFAGCPSFGFFFVSLFSVIAIRQAHSFRRYKDGSRSEALLHIPSPELGTVVTGQ